MTRPLFRPEVLAGRESRLSGDVSIAVPITWQSIGYLLFGALIAAILFLAFTSYARIERVGGLISPAAGVATVIPTRPGVLTTLDVRDGQLVQAGAPLGSVRAEEDRADTASTGERIEAAIARQDQSLMAQIDASQAAAVAEQARLEAQRDGLIAEIAQLESQIIIQTDLIASAEADLERVREVHARGFISGRDMQNREELVLNRRQGLAQLRQSIATRRSALTESGRSSAQVAAQSQAQIANLTAVRAEIAQSAANASGARAYVLRAPITGRVTALVARPGQSVNGQAPLMSIVPAGSELRADLMVSSAAIGFVKPGQEVRLAIDAFPYQRFGAVTGKVLTVATSAVSHTRPDGVTAMAYPVTVQLDQPNVQAFGRQEALLPGMTLTARIVTEKQTLLQWLFEPLFAVRRR